jgi:ribosome biogenesis GTPase
MEPVNESTSEKTSTGLVYKKAHGKYHVSIDDRELICSASSKLRKVLVYPFADPSSRRPTVDKVVDIDELDPVAIGDKVAFVNSGDGTGLITEVLPRKNKLSRLAAGKKPLEQVIVANIDQVMPVFSADKPKPKWQLLDRYLADAEWSDLPVTICITKMDLADEEIRDELREYQKIGYRVLMNSAVTGEGLDELKDALKDKVSVFVGKSGVGKTTLLNAIQPGLGLRVAEVSDVTGKGKHATSHLEMFALDFGGSVVDTPGMREFGLWHADSMDIAWLFREMRPFIGRCRFGAGCSHTHEPGCAIKEAVESGEICERRYDGFVRMR